MICINALGRRNVLTWDIFRLESDFSVGILHEKSRGSSAIQESPGTGAISCENLFINHSAAAQLLCSIFSDMKCFELCKFF